MFFARATSTSGHLVKVSESEGELAGKERDTPCPVEVVTNVKEENLKVTTRGEDSSISTEVNSRLNVSSYIKQGKDFPIVKVTGELSIKSMTGEGPNGITVLDDESILICYGSGILRYDKAGLLMGRVKKGSEEFSLPSDVCKLTDGKVIVVDSNGFHLLDKSLLFIRTLMENDTLDKFDESWFGARFSSLTEDEDGNIHTLLHNEYSNKPAYFLSFKKEGDKFNNCHYQFSMERLINNAMAELKIQDPDASMCTNLSHKDGELYITGDDFFKMYV